MMSTPTPPRLRVADLPNRKPTPVLLTPDAQARAEIAATLGFQEVRKLRLEGEITPQDGRDWALNATLGATITQTCVVSLDPVTTRIDEPVTRVFVAELAASEDAEVEMPDDVDVEPLPDVLDLQAIMVEALSLAAPAFPRAEGASLGAIHVAEEGVTPMSDDDAKPFAGLAALKDKLGSEGE